MYDSCHSTRGPEDQPPEDRAQRHSDEATLRESAVVERRQVRFIRRRDGALTPFRSLADPLRHAVRIRVEVSDSGVAASVELLARNAGNVDTDASR